MNRQTSSRLPGWRHRAQLGLLVLVAITVWAMFAVAFLPGVAPVFQDILCAVMGDCPPLQAG